MMRSWLGQFLIKRFNFFVNQVLPGAVGDKAILTPEVMTHYRHAQPTPEARAAVAALPGHIIGASDWLRSIRDERHTFVDKPALILWGLRDIAFRRQELERWQAALFAARVLTFEDCGHFLAEEAPEQIPPAFREFMDTPGSS